VPFSSTPGGSPVEDSLELAPGAALAGPPDPFSPAWWWLWLWRAFAGLQVLLVCGIPTQLVVFGGLYYAHVPMGTDGSLLTLDPAKISLQFFALSALLDTALVAILIRVFLLLHGETSRDVFLGRRPIRTEVVRGLLLLPALWVLVVAVVFVLSVLFPSLHNVPKNPYAVYMDTPIDAGIFVVVVVLAGGVREELQRAFILHRFERLGGPYVGLGVFSVAFGLLHVPQGFDAAIAVGLLGVIWGLVYIRRRSVVAPIVSHAGFDAVQVLQQLLLTTLSR